jgi:hypothetical protein
MQMVEYNLVQHAQPLVTEVVVLIPSCKNNDPKGQVSNIAANTKLVRQSEGLFLLVPSCLWGFTYQAIDLGLKMDSAL